MIGSPYRGFDDSDKIYDEQRNDLSCHRGTIDASGISGHDSLCHYRNDPDVDILSQYNCRSNSEACIHNNISSEGRDSTRSISSISKEMIRAYQSTIQNNSRSQLFMPDNAPISNSLEPRLQKLASQTHQIVKSIQNNAIVDSVSGTLVHVNDSLGSMMYMRSKSLGSHDYDTHTTLSSLSSSSTKRITETNSKTDRGIYSSQSMRSWGRTVTAEISTFTSEKVAPLFKRQNTYPFVSMTGNRNEHQGKQIVSFDYQLMKDNE